MRQNNLLPFLVTLGIILTSCAPSPIPEATSIPPSALATPTEVTIATSTPTLSPKRTDTPTSIPTLPPTPTPTLTPIPPTSTPSLPLTPTTPPTPQPEVTFTAVPLSVSITPAEATLPAGASTSFFVSVSPWTLGVPFPRSIVGLPSGVTAKFLAHPIPSTSTLVINTSCTTPPGFYTIGIQETISETTPLAQATLNVTDRLVSSQPGLFTGSFTANTIHVRRGGPSTMEYGPFLVLTLCDGVQPRKLKVSVQSATSDAGTPLAEPPRFSLFRSLVWPAPDSIQTSTCCYPNAHEVAQSDGWSLEWDIADGVYVLVFQRSPFEDSYPPEKRPASVVYSVEIVP